MTPDQKIRMSCGQKFCQLQHIMWTDDCQEHWELVIWRMAGQSGCSIGAISAIIKDIFCRLWWSFDGFPIVSKCEAERAKWADWNVYFLLVLILNIYRETCLLRIARSGCFKESDWQWQLEPPVVRSSCSSCRPHSCSAAPALSDCHWKGRIWQMANQLIHIWS